MKEKYNLKSIIVALIVLIFGLILVFSDYLWFKSEMNLWISIGCSLIASSLVILMTSLIVDKVKINPLDGWKISKIYATRAEKNQDAEDELAKLKYKLDIIAFGLQSFRNMKTQQVEDCLRRNVDIRILTMSPDSKYIKERELEEHDSKDHIKNGIKQLIEWANKLNSKGHPGRIHIKGYSCMTLDFYWRADDELYVGPYWYGIDSQQTITYKFVAGGEGFDQYSKYFEKLWNDNTLSTTLTQNKNGNE